MSASFQGVLTSHLSGFNSASSAGERGHCISKFQSDFFSLWLVLLNLARWQKGGERL